MPRNPDIILASSSSTRKSQLAKLGLEFTCKSPNIDETQKNNEQPSALVIRLSIEKAKIIAKTNPHKIIIAGDQVMQVGMYTLGKPKTQDRAVEQLSLCSGKKAIFYTGICLIDDNNNLYTSITTTEVKFKKLANKDIEKYIQSDDPLNCAGSIQVESKGLLLIEEIRSNDPYAVLGLPTTELSKLFNKAGLDLLEMCKPGSPIID